jgi:hypothetical protein
MKAIALLAVGLAVLAGCSDAPDKPEVKRAAGAPPVAPAAAEPVAESDRVIAYYFHRTVRCETCLRIEKQAHEVITNRFGAEVAVERLVFKAVNYELPENAHFLEDYQLGGPSLVLVRQKGGKDVERQVLGQTWDFAHIPPKLDLYIEAETRKFLEGIGSGAPESQAPAETR